jgi:hypothetical protein
MTFRQTASGSFDFPSVPGTPHCGPDSTPIQHVDYHVTIQYGANPLDENGFLLDNTWFSEYFAQWANRPVSISCENMCVKIADEIGDHARKWDVARPRGVSVTVALSAIHGVWVECTLTGGKN